MTFTAILHFRIEHWHQQQPLLGPCAQLTALVADWALSSGSRPSIGLLCRVEIFNCAETHFGIKETRFLQDSSTRHILPICMLVFVWNFLSHMHSAQVFAYIDSSSSREITSFLLPFSPSSKGSESW